jgi:hypothetical protein
LRFAIALVVWALAALGAVAQETTRPAPAVPMTREGYIEGLTRLYTLLEAGRIEEAREVAQDLEQREIEFEGDTALADATLLTPVRRAKSVAEARLLAPPIRRLVAALRGTADVPRVGARSEVLKRIETRDAIARGGEVKTLELTPLTLPEQVREALVAAYDFTVSILDKIAQWLRKLWPSRNPGSKGVGMTTTVAIVFIALVAGVLSFLAVRTLRKRGAGPAEVQSLEGLTSARDEDPLSRQATEWEKHAQELAAVGRWREAIRAWYHAVLVALFHSGALHYQKGRTNWEYVEGLPPGLSWRPIFVELTRQFDREWYGRRTSDRGAERECGTAARLLLGALRSPGGAA